MADNLNNTLTFGQVRVDSPYPVQTLTGVTITGSFNNHIAATVTGILPETERDQCAKAATANDPLKIYQTNQTGPDRLLFSGLVNCLNVNCQQETYTIHIEAKSYTGLLDHQLTNRSFQHQRAPYSEIITQVLAGYPHADFILIPPDRPTGQLLLQYRETDWVFLKRLATHFNTILIPDALGDGPRFWLGLRPGKSELEPINNYTAREDAAGYRNARAQGFNVRKRDFIKYDITTNTSLKLGDRVTFQDQPWIVEKTAAHFNHSLLSYQYTLGQANSYRQPRTLNRQISGLSLTGQVLDTHHAAVKLHLAIDQHQDPAAASWLPYAAPTGNIFYCMPEKGENVSLTFASGDETSGLAVNAVRSNGSNCTQTANPSIKYMALPTDQELKLSPQDVNLKNGPGFFINLDQAQGVTVHSQADLIISAQGKLTLEAQAAINIHADQGSIIAGSGPGGRVSQLYLMGGINGDTHIFAGGKLRQEGRFKEIFPDRLNAAIPFEKAPSFSWQKLALGVLAGLAVVAAVVLAVATGGAALAALGAIAATTASAAATGAAIGGTLAVGLMAASDIISQTNRSVTDYITGAFRGAVEGALSGAVLGAMTPAMTALQEAKAISPALRLLGHAGISGATGFITDTITQFPAILRGEYDPKRGLLAFAIGAAMPVGAKGLQRVFRNGPQCLKKTLCILAGEPVDAATGAMQYTTTDFALPGPLPLEWNRSYYSDSSHLGHLGYGTRCSFEMGLDIFAAEQIIRVYLADGRVAAFPALIVNETQFNPRENLYLKRATDHYRLFDPDTRYSYLFHPSPNGYINHKLTTIHNHQGHQITVQYNQHGYLAQITDSAGRALTVSTNQDGRITKVALGSQSLIEYRYDQLQNLIAVIDAAGQAAKLSYHEHRVVRKTDRNQNSFYWQYQWFGKDDYRVVKTWGDGRRETAMLITGLQYDSGCTIVTDSRGNATRHYFDQRNLCLKTVYADYTETRRAYDDQYQLVSEINEAGQITRYAYDEDCRLTGITLPEAGKTALAYDSAGRLSSYTNPQGHSRYWNYHDDDTLKTSTDEMGAVTTYTYNENKLLATVTNATGAAIALAYDQELNLSQVTLPNGAIATWTYDNQGNCLSAVNPLGAQDSYRYDNLNRLVRADLAGGNQIKLQYNGYDEVLRAQDNHRTIDFTYNILGSVRTKKQSGRQTRYQYDNENRLQSIIKAKGDYQPGETYTFTRDMKGHIIKETSDDQVTRSYIRDTTGLVQEIKRPGDRDTKYRRDKTGNIIRAGYHNGKFETFKYDKNGRLMEAANNFTTVKFERDAAGRVIKESRDDYWVASAYDATGNRTKVSSSLGANIVNHRDLMGQITHLAAAQSGQPAWAVRTAYNQLGQETRRLLPGELSSSFQYDNLGRPQNHQVRHNSHNIRSLSYQWAADHRLEQLTNELTRYRGVYGYDEFNNLISESDRGNWDFIYRTADPLGNIYETKDKTDRIYGPGGRLEKSQISAKELRDLYQRGQSKQAAKGVEFGYDQEGNLIRKVEANGDTWQYQYDASGMLAQVTRPDGMEVTFKYDPLGRRIEKKTPEQTIIKKDLPGRRMETHIPAKTTKYLWDGNNLLHQWEERNANPSEETTGNEDVNTSKDTNLVTWVFNDGFVPLAKLTGQGYYSIVSDYLGTPVGAYNAEGECVWSAELDIYGRVKEHTGEVDFVPFRYQGQYSDLETNLYYNRFRYYDPDTGLYIQQDPIGLAGENPTLYAYVGNVLIAVDPLGLTWEMFDVGPYNVLRKMIAGSGMNATAHHVGQTTLMKRFIPGYVRSTGPAIVVPGQGHISNIVGRGRLNNIARVFANPRDLLARDIMELRRVYPDIPRAKLQELIQLNKKMYPEAFKKCR